MRVMGWKRVPYMLKVMGGWLRGVYRQRIVGGEMMGGKILSPPKKVIFKWIC
jgi:hypothetical protein